MHYWVDKCYGIIRWNIENCHTQIIELIRLLIPSILHRFKINPKGLWLVWWIGGDNALIHRTLVNSRQTELRKRLGRVAKLSSSKKKKKKKKKKYSKSSWPDLVDNIISILPGWIKISINVCSLQDNFFLNPSRLITPHNPSGFIFNCCNFREYVLLVHLNFHNYTKYPSKHYKIMNLKSYNEQTVSLHV